MFVVNWIIIFLIQWKYMYGWTATCTCTSIHYSYMYMYMYMYIDSLFYMYIHNSPSPHSLNFVHIFLPSNNSTLYPQINSFVHPFHSFFLHATILCTNWEHKSIKQQDSKMYMCTCTLERIYTCTCMYMCLPPFTKMY